MFPTVKWLFFDVGSTLVDEQLCYVLRLQEIASLANLPYELIWETAMQFYRQNQKGDARGRGAIRRQNACLAHGNGAAVP